MTKVVVFDEIGGPEVLRLDNLEPGRPAEHEVLIDVEAIGLNRAESWFRSGLYYVQPSFPRARLGYEAAGTIAAAGSAVAGFAPGDKISTVPAFHLSDYGVYGTQAVVPASAVLHRPDGGDAVTGAATWLAYLTAYGALIEVGGIQKADTILVTAASSSVGLAAIQIANHVGAIPVATTRTTAKKQRLLDAGAAHVIVTEDDDLLDQVATLTGENGLALAFDAVGGPGMNDLARAVRPGGTLVSYGFQNGAPPSLPFPDFPFSLNIRVHAVFELARDPGRLRRAERFINAGLRSGAFTPTIDRTLDLAEIVEAHRYLESGAQFGKIVVTVQR